MWLKPIKIHLLIWTLFIFQESILVSVLSGVYNHPLIWIAHYAVTITLFYFFSDYSLAWALRTKTIWRIVVVICIQVALYSYAHYLATTMLIFFKIGVDNQSYIPFDSVYIISNLYRCMLFMLFATGYYFLKTYLKEREKNEILERQRLEEIIERERRVQEMAIIQNAILKAQINPHFLFNTLDFIYHKVNHHSESAGEAVVKLAQLMRFAIDSDQMEDTITLSDEIEQVENLVYLYQIRKPQALNVKFTYNEEVKQVQFIPFVLLTLIENMFNHADLSNDDEIARLQIKIIDEFLHIISFNLINHKKATHSNKSDLANIQKRLHYAYGEGAVFERIASTTHFKVNISIPLRLLKTP